MADVPVNHLGWVADPNAVAGLCRDRPDPDEHPVIAGRYDVTPKGGRRSNPNGPWHWCSHCQAPTHWVGFVVVADSGKYHMIGSNCGAKHYGGERFRLANRRYEDIEYSRFIDERLAQINSMANAASAEIAQVLASGWLALLEAKRSDIRTACPEAFRRLVTHAKSGLSLSTHEPARGVKGSGFITLGLGQLEGAALVFSELRSCCSNLETALARAISVKEDGASVLETKSHAVDEAEQAARALLKSIAEAASAHRFFLQRNLRRVSRWSSPMTRFYVLSHDEDALLTNDATLGRSRIEPLGAFPVPRLKACKGLLNGA